MGRRREMSRAAISPGLVSRPQTTDAILKAKGNEPAAFRYGAGSCMISRVPRTPFIPPDWLP